MTLTASKLCKILWIMFVVLDSDCALVRSDLSDNMFVTSSLGVLGSFRKLRYM